MSEGATVFIYPQSQHTIHQSPRIIPTYLA